MQDQSVKEVSDDHTITRWFDKPEDAPVVIDKALCYGGRNFISIDTKAEIDIDIHKTFAIVKVIFRSISEEEQKEIQELLFQSKFENERFYSYVHFLPVFRDGLLENEKQEISTSEGTDAKFPLVTNLTVKIAQHDEVTEVPRSALLKNQLKVLSVVLTTVQKQFPNVQKL